MAEFVVEHVGFGDCEEALFVDELWVEASEFFEEYVVLLCDVVGVGGYHEEQYGVAFDVAEEAESESSSFAGSFDDAGYVGHDE